MHPEFLLSISGSAYTVRAYDAFSILAMLSVMLLAPPLLRCKGFKTGMSLAITAVLLVAFLVGARLLNYAANPMQYGGLLKAWSWSFAGFSLYGGLVAAGLVLLILSSVFRCRMWAAADALVLPAGMAFSLAKIGCFLNGCCAGKATDSVLGVTFPAEIKETELLGRLLWFTDKAETIQVWPTQLFELGLALLGLSVILPLVRRLNLAEGSAALMYAIWFTAARWMVLPFRLLPYSLFITEVFYPVLYGTIILVCGVLLHRRNRELEI